MQSTMGIGALGTLSVNSHYPLRPGHGTRGKKVVVYANYFRVQVEPDLYWTRYNIEITPAVTGGKMRRIFELLLESPDLGGVHVASDWKSMIITRPSLNIADGHMIDITYRGDGEDEPLPNARTYKIRVVTPISLAIADLVRYLRATAAGPAFPHQLETIQGLNVVFGHHPRSSDTTASINRSTGNRYYSLNRGQQNAHNIGFLGGGREALRGYYQSVRPATGGILVNVNPTHNVFLEPRRLDDLYPLLGSANKANKVTLNKMLSKIRVKVIHLPVKRSKSNKEIPRVKAILGLARPGDGRKPGELHAPQVSRFGAGPKDVKFWLSENTNTSAGASSKPAKKGKAKKTPDALPTNAYISVYDYFKISELSRSRRLSL
jgi:hypothetical protein